jgi:hypothetical protein
MAGDERQGTFQDRFEQIVLRVAGEILHADRRIAPVVDAALAEDPLDREDPTVRADLIICVAECLRLVSAPPDGTPPAPDDFAAFAASCRTASVHGHADTPTRIQRTLRRFTAGWQAYSQR